MFAAYYGNIDGIELLASSDANLNLVDKFGRSVLHYAAQSDHSKLIQTIFLTIKGNGVVVGVSKDIEPKPSEESKWDGPYDDQYEGMEHNMNLLDIIQSNGDKLEDKPCA